MKYVLFLISIVIVACSETTVAPEETKDPKSMTYSEFMDSCVKGAAYQPDEVPLCQNVDSKVFCDTACGSPNKTCNYGLDDLSILKNASESIPDNSITRIKGLSHTVVVCTDMNNDILFNYKVQSCVSDIVEFCEWQYTHVVNPPVR